MGKANERTIGMAKFYRLSWYEFAKKWQALMDANAPKTIKLFKVSRSGKGHQKVVIKSDWKSEQGYEPIVRSTSEQETENLKGIQKFQFILSQFPNNLALRKIAQKRELEMLDLTPEELKEVEEAEEQAQRLIEQQSQAQGAVTSVSPMQQQMSTPQSQTPSDAEDVARMVQELATI